MVLLNEIYLIIISGISIIFGLLFGYFIIWLKNHSKKSIPKDIDISHINKKNMKKNKTSNFSSQKQLLELEEIDGIRDQGILNKSGHILEDEVKLYQFEKDLVTRAIENILNASRNNSIDDFERDRLLIKYKEQLKSLNQNMERIQSEIDITKLMNFRDDLMNILENKISQIDERITSINNKYKNFGSTYVENMGNKSKVNNKNSNNYQNETYGKNSNSIKKIVNNNPDSEYTKGLLDIKISKAREIVDYKVDQTIEENDIIEEEKIRHIRDKVLNALDSLENTKPIEDAIKNRIQSINKEDKDREQTEEEEEIKISGKEIKTDLQGYEIINTSTTDTKEYNKTINKNTLQTNLEIPLEPKITNKNESKFPLAGFFSRLKNRHKIKEEKESDIDKIIKKDEEKDPNRNPLGNIFKNIK